ncbi:MAG TPA: glycosyltransferase [Pirellulaceae bacterium]|nr:glycosyltransferase [Pirellulaceae bacterium]
MDFLSTPAELLTARARVACERRLGVAPRRAYSEELVDEYEIADRIAELERPRASDEVPARGPRWLQRLRARLRRFLRRETLGAVQRELDELRTSAIAGWRCAERLRRSLLDETLVARERWRATDASAATGTQDDWRDGFARALAACNRLEQPSLRYAIVTPWRTRCGIASHSAYLIEALSRHGGRAAVLARHENESLPSDVVRCWRNHDADSIGALVREATDRRLDGLFLQFSISFFHVPQWGELIERLAAAGLPVVLICHHTHAQSEPPLGTIAASLRRAQAIVVHTSDDRERLRREGIVDNVALVPQGAPVGLERSRENCREELELPLDTPLVTTYGFLLPHKGAMELLEALTLLHRDMPEARLLMINAQYPHDTSRRLAAECRRFIRERRLAHGAALIDDYLSDEESRLLVGSGDVVAFPYQATNESSSAAVRGALAAGRPIACTPLPIFDELSGVVHRLPGATPAEMASGLRELLRRPEQLRATNAAQRDWLAARNWPAVAGTLAKLLRGAS